MRTRPTDPASMASRVESRTSALPTCPSGPSRPLALALVLACALSAASCADEKKKPSVAPATRGARTETIAQAAAERGLSERYLLTAAYVQGNFAADAGEKSAFPRDSKREPMFGLAAADLPRGTPDTLAGKARVLAARVADCGAKKGAKLPFDWLLCTADAIVGSAETDPNVRDFQIRMVLLPLIDAHNKGFAALLPGGEVSVLPPATEKERIDVKSLDAGRARYVSGFRFDRELASEMYVDGAPEAQADTRTPGEFPRIVVRHCPSNALTCLEHFRRSKETGAHLLAYRTAPGDVEMAQLQPLARDLNWYGKPQRNSIVLVIAGTSGMAEPARRVDWMDWEDYVALRRVFMDVITQAGRNLRVPTNDWLQPGGASYKPEVLERTVVEYLAEPAETAGIPKGAPAFLLPTTWDSKLFREVLAFPGEPRMQGQIRVEAPREGQTYSGFNAFFSFFPDPDTALIEMYQDAAGRPAGDPWELVLNTDYDPTQQKFSFSREFRRTGVTGNGVRAVKIVSRAAGGRILGSRVVRFALSGLADRAAKGTR